MSTVIRTRIVVVVFVFVFLGSVLAGVAVTLQSVRAAAVTVNCSGTSGSPTAVTESDLTDNDVTFSNTGGDGYCVLDAAVSAASVVVGSGVVLTHAASDSTGVNITTTGNLTLTGEILVSGKGCAGGTNASQDGYGPNTSTGVCAQTTSGYGDGGRGGAGHGGIGGAATAGGGTASTKYDSPTAPTLLGSGGAGGPNPDENGGAGGGKIRLDVGGTLFIDGAMKANGSAPATDIAAGGGSGGAIYITTATLDTTSGSGAAVQANGGNAYSHGGAGGGGRVAVYYNTLVSDGTNFSLTNITATKGSKGTFGSNGDPGSTFILDRKSDDGIGDVRVTTGLDLPDGTDFSRTNFTLDSGSTITCDAQTTLNFTASSNITDNGSTFNCTAAITTLNITATSTLTTTGVNWDFTNTTTVNLSAATWTSSGTNTIDVTKAGSAMDWNVTNALTLNNLTYTGATPGTSASTGGVLSMDNAIAVVLVNTDIISNINWTDLSSLNLDATSSISANGKGCDGGAQSANGYGPDTTSGVCTQSTSGYGANGRTGAGHGGAGGRSNGTANTGATYGSNTAPVLYGSGGGGGGNSGETGGAGGGKIRLDMTGTFTLDGTLSANGSGPADNAGGGSGGSVYVSTTGSLAGSGTANSVAANGGAGINWGGGGGGGRVVLAYGTSALSSGTIDAMMQVSGGASGGTGSAAAGSAGSTSNNDLPAFSSAKYEDSNSDGTIDQVVLTFDETVSLGGTVASTRFTWTSSSGANGFGGSLSGNASASGTDITITIGSAEADETGYSTIPTISYSDNSDDATNNIQDASGNIVQTFAAQNVSDSARPRAKTVTFYDASSSDGKLDLITVVFTENISAAANASADWALSSAANFSGISEGTVECNSGSAGANECDYNFTTTTVKTNVGDLSLAYTAGSSLTDGTNTANSLTLTSSSTPAFTDAVAPAAINALISIAGATGTGGAFKISDTVTVTWDNSSTAGDVSSVTANLSQFGGGASATMTDTTACGGTASNNIYEACYTILGSEAIDDANNNVSVTATDAASNSRTGTDTTDATVDTIVPTVSAANISVTGASGTSGAFKNGDTAVPTWNNTASGDNNSDTISSVSVSAANFRSGDTALSATNASGTWTASLSGAMDSQDDANNNVSITATDNAGNTTTTAGTNNYTLDTIVPTLTNTNITVTGCTGTSGACKNGDTGVARWDNSVTGDNNSDTIASATFNASALDDGSSSLSGSVLSGIYSATIGTLDSQDDTGNTITATIVDNAGNSTGPTTSSASYTVDTIAPTVTAGKISVTGGSGTSGAFKNGDTGTARWDNSATGDNNSDTLASVTMNASAFDDGSSALSGSVTSGIYTATVGALDSQDDTSNNITVTAVDNAGNSTATAGTNNYTVDTIVPTVTQASVTVAGATGTSGAFKNGNSPVLTWNPTTSGESDTIASASFDGSSFKSGDTALSGSLATNWTASLSGAMDLQDDTSNAVTVTVVDNVGNSTGPTTSSTTYTIDTVLPTISTAVYQDNNGNGIVDRVVLTFSEDVSSGFSADKDEWTFPTASELTLTAPTLDASVTNSTTTVTIAVGADANETGHTTAPTIAYTNTSGTLQDDAGNAVANVTAQTLTDDAGPLLLSSDPSDAEQNVSRNDAVTMTFSEPIVTASFAYTCCGTGTDPGSRAVTWSSNDTVATVAHAQFQSSNDITLTVTDAPDGASNTFVGAVAAAANPFTFTTAAAGGVVVGVNDTAGPTSGSTSNQTITLVSPNGGGTYTAGSSTPIAWTQRGRIDMVNVAYSLDNGATWTILASGIRNLGSYLWTLPDIVADRVRIRVQGTDLASVYTEDSSDSAFSIVKAPVASQTAPEPSLPPADNAVAVDTKTPIILELGEPVVEVDTPREEALKLAVGDVLRGVTDPAVYVIRSDGKRAVFPDSETYFSYFDSFDHVVTINDDQLRKLPLGKRVTVRPGTWLVKIQSDPRVYAVEDGGLLRHVPNEDTARFLYGDTWNSQVRDVNVAFFKDYRIGEPLPSNTYLPEGTVFSYEESPQLYVVQNRIRRLFLDAEAFALNHFQDRFVRNISLLFEFEDGEPIQGIDQDLLDALIRS